MRCPNCRTLVLFAAGEPGDTGRLVSCPRCPAVWLARRGEGLAAPARNPPPMTRRGPLIIEGDLAAAGRPAAPASVRRAGLRRYGMAAGVAAIAVALAAAALLAPDVSALPVLALIEGGR